MTPAALQAQLLPRRATTGPTPDRPAEPVLKDTLSEATTQQPAASAALLRAARGGSPARPAALQRTAQRKLAAHLFYPPEAIARGLEGEARLLLTLDDAGRVLEADIAASSGHAVLDRAAVAAAYAMGRLPAAGGRELILPVVFRLQ